MSRDTRDFEKKLKAMIRGDGQQAVGLNVLWDRLGPAADGIAVDLFNRPGAWSAAAAIASVDPHFRQRLESIASRAGITAEGLEVITSMGIDPLPDAPSRRALGILETAGKPDAGEWMRARTMMLADENVLTGALSLMELNPQPAFAEFLSHFSQDLPDSVDQRLRKTLYRLKQKGITVQEKTEASAQKEWYLFGENRLPLWQLVLCFRFHSAFSSAGDLYILRILEGREVAPIEQKTDLRLTHAEFVQLANRYSDQIERELRLRIRFLPLPAENAYYFLRRSLENVRGKSGESSLENFLKFVGAGEGVAASAPDETTGKAEAAELLNSEYFQLWMADPEAISDFMEKMKDLERGPILLVGGPLNERKQEITRNALNTYFNEDRRRLWRDAFLKAAMFLQSTPERENALAIAEQFNDASIPLDQLSPASVLFERAVAQRQETEKLKEKEQKESSLIVSPEEFARSRRGQGQS